MSPAPNFNRIARLYRWMELFSFGPFLRRCRCSFLPRLGKARRALVLGDGDGRFTTRLLEENRRVKVRAIDGSPAMLSVLARRARAHAGRVSTEIADLRLWQPETTSGPSAAPDLIVTHFFLDCLSTEEVRGLAERLRTAVLPSALWVVSEFAIPPGWFGALVARPVVRGLYLAFGWLTGLAVRTLPDHISALEASGFTLVERRRLLAGLLVAEMWSAAPPISINSNG